MKKVIAVLLSFCLLFALASCGGGSSSGDTVKEDSSPAETAASTPEPAASSDDSPPPDSGAADEGKEDEEEEGYPKYTGEIIVSILGDPDGDHSNFQYLTEAYKKYQPDVTFSFEPLKTDSYVPWLATQLASGHIRPDIVSGNYAATYQGYVNLNLYRNRVNHYTGRTWQEELNFDLISETNAKGEKYMLPSEAVHIYWYYNKAIFDMVGIKPPLTDVEFVNACDMLLEAGYTPFASHMGWQLNQWFLEVYLDQFARHFDDFVRAQPGDWCFDDLKDGVYEYDAYNPDQGTNYTYSPQRLHYNLKNGNLKFTSPEFIAFATMYQNTFPSKYNYPEYMIDYDSYARFLTGRVAMMSDGTWSLTGLARDLAGLSEERRQALNLDADVEIQAFEWGVFENPSATGPDVVGPVRSIESASGVYLSCIDKGADQVERVIDFMHFWLSSEGYQAWVDGAMASPLGYSPAGPLQVYGVTLPSEIQAVLDEIKMLGNAEYSGKYYPAWLGPEYDQYSKDLLLKLLDGDISPEEFANDLQGVYDNNHERIWASVNLTAEDVDYPERQPAQ